VAPGATRVTQRAFTLIELLVAITVLAIVAVLGWRGLDSIIRARTAITDGIEQTRGMQLTFAQLESDCAHIAPGSLVAERPTLLAGDGVLLLVRTVFADDEPTRVQVVAWRYVDGRIERWESPATRELAALDSTWRTATDEASSRDAIVMQSGVTGMSVRTWVDGGAGWRSASASAATSNAPATGAPPPVTGLEVSLALRDHPGPLVKVFLLGTV
jgi:general secretion pathway protein J